MTTTLFCTVGGSHQPLVTAIRAAKPDYVVFLCTGRDPATGKPGSRQQIEGMGLVIKASPQDDKPSLPAIPAQCDLPKGSWEVVEVSADDLVAALAAIKARMTRLRAELGGRILADYTGGTKSMSAALVMAAVETPGVDLQLVTGARSDLVKVVDHTQTAVAAAASLLRFRQDARLALTTWGRYAWQEAAEMLSELEAPGEPRLRALWQRAKDVSAGLAAWDRFDHRGALDRLKPYEAVFAPSFPEHYVALKRMAEGGDAADGYRVWDLWLNAWRRATDGRLDDAVARVYRLLEWTAQWQLQTAKGWRTGDLPKDIAEPAGITANRDGRYQAGLWSAWQLAAFHCGEPVAGFLESEGGAVLDRLHRRNQSILAHGFSAIDAGEWGGVWAPWLREVYEPLLRQLLARSGIRNPPPQLPNAYPWEEEFGP